MTLTKKQLLQLEGLSALSDFHMQRIDDIFEAAKEITQDNDNLGWTCDYINGFCDVETLIEKLNITTEEETDEKENS